MARHLVVLPANQNLRKFFKFLFLLIFCWREVIVIIDYREDFLRSYDTGFGLFILQKEKSSDKKVVWDAAKDMFVFRVVNLGVFDTLFSDYKPLIDI